MVNQFLGLSLFIMLLSFFIILNALSNFEEHISHKVMDSISVAFSDREVIEETEANVTEDLQASFRDGDTLDKLQKLFQAQISGAEVKKNRMGTLMHIRLPAEEFERQILRAGGNSPGFGVDLGATLVSLLTSSDDVQYRMEILLNLPVTPAKFQNDSPKEALLRMKRVALYAQALEDAGLPKQFVTPGVTKGTEKFIDLYFRRYQPFNPLGNQEGETS